MVYLYQCPGCKTMQPLIARHIDGTVVWLRWFTDSGALEDAQYGHHRLVTAVPQSPLRCAGCGYEPTAHEIRSRGGVYGWCGCRYSVEQKQRGVVPRITLISACENH